MKNQIAKGVASEVNDSKLGSTYIMFMFMIMFMMMVITVTSMFMGMFVGMMMVFMMVVMAFIPGLNAEVRMWARQSTADTQNQQ